MASGSDSRKDENVSEMFLDESQPASSLHMSSEQSFETLDIISPNTEDSKEKMDSSAKTNISLYLNKSLLGKNGCRLTDFITQHGYNPKLEMISLRQCSMPEHRWDELLQFTPTCKYLWQLDLSRNAIGDDGLKLARII